MIIKSIVVLWISASRDWQESGQQVLTGAYTQTRRPAHKRRRYL